MPPDDQDPATTSASFALVAMATGVLLPIKALPGARRNGIAGVHAQASVAVTQAPEKGKANSAIISVLADELELKESQIELVSGTTSTQKKFLVTGMPLADLRQRIDRALNRSSN